MKHHTSWIIQAITDLELAGLSQAQHVPMAALSQYDAKPGLQSMDVVRVLSFSVVTEDEFTYVQFWAHKHGAVVDLHVTRSPRALVFNPDGTLKGSSSYTPNLLPSQAWTMAKSVLTPTDILAYN